MVMSSHTDMSVEQALRSRQSIRAFLPRAVERKDLESILSWASRAPSGTNTQPWKVYVVQGKVKEQLTEKILRVFDDDVLAAQYAEPYAYYPPVLNSPYIERRRKVGWDLYNLLGLTRDNKEGMHRQHGRNYKFFDAPVGLLFTIDKSLGLGSWLDYGMFIQSIMIAARSFGLDTCPQAAFLKFHTIISQHLNIPDNEMLICGMSLGYADHSRIENSLKTEREPLSEFVKFIG